MALIDGRCSAWVAASILAMLSLMLAGCGGGGGSPTPSPSPPGSTAAPTPPPTTTTITTTTEFVYTGYSCESDLKLPAPVEVDKKGFCLDDTTFTDCSDKMIGLWPHTQTPVSALRMFKAWKDKWGDETKRDKAWDNLEKYVKLNNIKILFGNDITCDPAADDKDWANILTLMKRLGPDHVLGVAVGNEMDVFWRVPDNQRCLNELWNGRYQSLVKRRVDDMDSNGFENAKITIVWGMSALEQKPFKEDNQAKINTLVTWAYNEYKGRFVWTFNIYAIWDTSLAHDPGNVHQCQGAINTATSDYTAQLVKQSRMRIKMVTGNNDDPFWIGETGWSSPHPDGCSLLQKDCPAFCSKDTFKKIYENFLAWDLSIADVTTEFPGPDRVFYFAMRNSANIGMNEYFGLVNKCEDTKCKLNGMNWAGSLAGPGFSNTTLTV